MQELDAAERRRSERPERTASVLEKRRATRGPRVFRSAARRPPGGSSVRSERFAVGQRDRPVRQLAELDPPPCTLEGLRVDRCGKDVPHPLLAEGPVRPLIAQVVQRIHVEPHRGADHDVRCPVKSPLPLGRLQITAGRLVAPTPVADDMSQLVEGLERVGVLRSEQAASGRQRLGQEGLRAGEVVQPGTRVPEPHHRPERLRMGSALDPPLRGERLSQEVARRAVLARLDNDRPEQGVGGQGGGMVRAVGVPVSLRRPSCQPDGSVPHGTVLIAELNRRGHERREGLDRLRVELTQVANPEIIGPAKLAVRVGVAAQGVVHLAHRSSRRRLDLRLPAEPGDEGRLGGGQQVADPDRLFHRLGGGRRAEDVVDEELGHRAGLFCPALGRALRPARPDCLPEADRYAQQQGHGDEDHRAQRRALPAGELAEAVQGDGGHASTGQPVR